jgi:hypothetical protein
MYSKQKAYSKIMINSTKEEEERSSINTVPSSSTDVEVTLEELLDDIPIGKFHYRLLVICGMAFMADAMEVRVAIYLSRSFLFLHVWHACVRLTSS